MNASLKHAMRNRILPAVTAVALMTVPLAEARADHISNAGAAVLGGIAGLAVGAAIADSAHPHVYYPPRYQPYPYPQPYYAQPYYAQPYPAYYPRPVYRPAYAAPFSPAPGVTCYPGRAVCFNANGTVANQWSDRVFGY